VLNGSWLSFMPTWFKTGAVILGLLSLGATGGKVVNDYVANKELVFEVRMLRIDVERQTCIQIAQLRHGDWTLCLIPSDLH